MHQKDFSKIDEMNIHADIVFANQCDRTAYEELKFDGYNAKMISTATRGVGVNRNIALTYASADICLMADDDVKYYDDAKEKVLAEFERHPDADVIVFDFKSTDPTRESVSYTKTHRYSKLNPRTPWGAIRIAFRLNSVRKANVWFTTLFGGGCIFPSGEDSMWIKGLRKAGLTFYVSKETIGTVSYETSTWFTGYDEKYYYGVGAYYQAYNKRFIHLKYLYTIYRTRFHTEVSRLDKIRWMSHGKKGYKLLLSYDEYKSKLSCK